MNIRLVCLAFASAGLAPAATEVNFGLIGVTQFENARLTGYCDGSVMPACDFEFMFEDAGGRVLKTTTLTLRPNSGGYLDFTPVVGAGGAVQIDPCFKVLRGAGYASLEIFDTLTQRTRILINWGDRSQPQTGDIDFPLAGITPFDTAHMAVYCDGSVMPTPCDVSLEFHDINGGQVKTTSMILPAGSAGFLDLKWSEKGSTARRVEIEPCIKVLRGSAVATLAIVDNYNARTVTLGYPAVLAQ